MSLNNSIRHPVPSSISYFFQQGFHNMYLMMLQGSIFRRSASRRSMLCDTTEADFWQMTSDGQHWDGGSSVGCVVGTHGFRKNNMSTYLEGLKERQNDADARNDFIGKSLRKQRLVQRVQPTVLYDGEFPTLLFTGSLLPPREGSLLHEENVPSYVRAWYGIPNGMLKPVSWDYTDREGGIELHVRGDGRVYDFAYMTFSTGSAQWDYVCAPFQTTDRSEALFPLIESMRLGEFWQQEVSQLNPNKDVNVTKVNQRANQWVQKVKKQASPHVVHPDEICLDYDIIRIPWNRFFVRADEKKTNHLVPIPDAATLAYESMNNAGIGIYSDEMGDFACEVLFVGVYRDESAFDLANPSVTVLEERRRREGQEREAMENREWREKERAQESADTEQKQESSHKKDEQP